MADEIKSYRITAKRPIGGRMRKVGDVVALSACEYAAEAGWGGLEPVEAEASTKTDVTAESEAPAAEAETTAASGKAKRK